MTAALILVHRNPGKYAFNVLLGALEAEEALGGFALTVAKSLERLDEALQHEIARGARIVVAWSSYSTSLPECAAQARELRARFRGDWTALIGGVHATAEPESVLRNGFDRVAVGEGEHTIRALARVLREGRSIDEIAGIGRLEHEKLVLNGRAPIVESLDEFPAFSTRHHGYNAIEITRGCIYACRFCQTPFLSKARFRHRSPRNVAHWAGAIARAGMRDVRFISPTSLSYGSPDASVNLDAVEDLLARVRTTIGTQGRIFFGTFPSEVRPEHVTPESLDVLKRWVDNDNLVIGGQSGSERILTRSHRGHDVEAIERAVRTCTANGFRANVDFILGLPDEEPADVAATVSLMERLTVLGAKVHGHTFMPLPGTPFRDAAPGNMDAATIARLESLEGGGRLYGQWKRQIETARELADRRSVSGRR